MFLCDIVVFQLTICLPSFPVYIFYIGVLIFRSVFLPSFCPPTTLGPIPILGPGHCLVITPNFSVSVSS